MHANGCERLVANRQRAGRRAVHECSPGGTPPCMQDQRPRKDQKRKGPDPFGLRASTFDRVAGARCYAPPGPGFISSSSPRDATVCWLSAGWHPPVPVPPLAAIAACADAHRPQRASERRAMWLWVFTMNSEVEAWMLDRCFFSHGLCRSEDVDCKESSLHRQAGATIFLHFHVPSTPQPCPTTSPSTADRTS